MNTSQKRILRELADCYGVQTSYYDVFHKRKKASDFSLFNVLKSLRVPVETKADLAGALHEFYKIYWQRKIEPVLVAWEGKLNAVPVRLTQQEALRSLRCRLVYEEGTEISWEVDMSTLPALNTFTFDGTDFIFKAFEITTKLPPGYHRLFIQTHKNQFDTFILSAPRHSYRHGTKNAAKSFGLFTPVYALHSQRSVGCGDLTDFKNLITWTAQQGGNFVSTTPLHPAFLDEPCEFSPYSPVSRLFWNELYLDITAIAEFGGESLPSEVAALNASKLVEYQKIMALKRPILERMCQKFLNRGGERRNAFENYLTSHPLAKDYAAFRATCELHKQSWNHWPEAQRAGVLPAQIFNDPNYHYHLYVQWQIHEQLHDVVQHAKASSTLLYLDTPLGVHPHGYDTWRFQQDFSAGATIGAPPDGGFPLGQNWGIAPLHPNVMRQTHYNYFIKCLKTIMPQHDLLRLDHVMSLHRLYFIPENCKPQDGVFVHYPAEELYAILSIESHHHRVGLIGENLGTVPSYVNKMMRTHHVDPMYVLQYEMDSGHLANRKVPKNCIASLNTHDMPPFAAYLQGLDIKQRIQVGVLDPAAEAAELKQRQTGVKQFIKELSGRGLLKTPQEDFTQQIVFSSLVFLAAEKVQYLLINLEDLWLETAQQNIPSLPATNSLNWQHKHRYTMKEFEKNNDITWILSQVAQARTAKKSVRPKLLEQLPASIAAPTFSHFVSLITSDDLYLFNEGNHFRLYEKLGAHCIIHEGQEGVYFAVWAPNAKQVSVTGDFNGWNKHSHPLKPRENSGIWEGFIAGVKAGTVYKYFIQSHQHDYQVEKADPFGFYHEIPPKTASIVTDLNYDWQDKAWMQHRAQSLDKPMAVYEIHLGSWRRIPEEDNRFLTYREIAPLLSEYVTLMGYTHVELMPIMEHPFYDSWGYQITGYFAPTSRYGTPQDFMYLVDYLHQHNIGVILDWVPSHFPYDQHGLAYFDGTSLFEHADPRQGFHPDWTSAIFNYGRSEVRAFLISSAMLWLDKYHIDGLRVDGVASMLYLDYSRKQGEWLPNIHGGRENLEAIYFLQRLNQVIYQHYPEVQTIAEESTSWGGVSKPTYIGGLGFGLKWDMGWMHDTLNYFSFDAIHRSYHHNDITFRMIYAFTENFMLPLSHDEVVHGKKSLLCKMPGPDGEKFANVRLLLGYMYAQSGKKITFMGNDFGVWHEWNCHQSLDWHLLSYAPHQGLQKWARKLNHLYKNEPALHSLDCDPAGFEWIDGSDKDHSVMSFLRKSSGQDVIIVILNATPMRWDNHRIGVPHPGKWVQIANSDASEYGGSGVAEQESVFAEELPFHFRPFSLNLTLPPLGVVFYKHVGV